MKQRTLAREVSIKGNSLHTGDAVTLTLKPAPVDHGFVFRRVDLSGAPELRPRVDFVTDLVRATTIQVGHAKVQTVEHVLSALSGCGIDNAIIEMDASEPPILDGSAKPFVDLIMQGEPMEQATDREYFTLDAAVSVTKVSRPSSRCRLMICGSPAPRPMIGASTRSIFRCSSIRIPT